MSRNPRQNRLCRTAIAIAGGERVRASVPPPLPPDPPVALRRLANPLDAADIAVGRLDGMAAVLGATPLVAGPFADVEALRSAQLAGSEARLADLYIAQSGAPDHTGATAAHARCGLEHGWARVAAGAALSPVLLGEIHARMTGGDDPDGAPSELRGTQTWLGGASPVEATFVAPPPGQVPALMADWQRFVHHDTSGLPPLIRAGLAHAQFATIQPFSGANQRMARLLIPLLLASAGVLRAPLLCPSRFFARQPALYAEHLAAVRARGAWEEWLEFFLQGIAESAREVASIIDDLLALCERDRQRAADAGRDPAIIHSHLCRQPVSSVEEVAEALGISRADAGDGMQRLAAIGIVQPVGPGTDARQYAYGDYLALIGRD